MKTSTFLASSFLAVSSLASAAFNSTYYTGACDHISSHSEVRVKWETAETLVCLAPDTATPALASSPLLFASALHPFLFPSHLIPPLLRAFAIRSEFKQKVR